MKKLLSLFGLFLLLITLSAYIAQFGGDKPVAIPATKQRTGDAQRGYEYLTEGDYVKGGIPYQMFLFGKGKESIFLKRGGPNEKLPHDFTAVTAANGEVLVAPNCLQCHSQVFENQLVIGLGNSLVNFSKTQGSINSKGFEIMEGLLKSSSPKKYEAAASFFSVMKSVAPYIYVPVQGVNTASSLTAALVAHRDPLTLKWNETPSMEIHSSIIPSDTPPWWLLKKKNAMFYNGFGRGDFGRFLMASNLLTVNDSSESAMVDKHMPHVLSYIYSLQPPKYPKDINNNLAQKGMVLFQKNCASCHGSYGEDGKYPNLLIPQSIIKTDSLLSGSNYSNPQFVDWFNKSWFTTGDHPARLVPFKGYIAPPLDGIWISAPYFHNASVPNLEGVLNSKARPSLWSRQFNNPEYDYENVGWKYKAEKTPGPSHVYNTALPGYGNGGHYFGDRLSDAERKAVIAYLKTL